MKEKLHREKALKLELINYNPIRNGLNVPFKNYTLRLEDIIPALSGTIGKIALVAAFAMAWAKGLGISSEFFVQENVRLELVVGSILTIIFSAIFNPYAAPPGTLAPLIPLIPLMASLGVHPLVLGLLIGFFGLIVSKLRFFDKIMELNGTATRGGIILLFGIMGVSSSIDTLMKWANNKNSSMFTILIMLGIIVYLIISKFNYKWLMIPSAAIIGLLIPALYGVYPEIKTAAALPMINPEFWWNNIWGVGFGLTPMNFIKAMPFAFLAIVMWPTDGIAIKTIQESNYGEKAEKAIFDMNSTFMFASIRNIIGSFLGGSQTAAVWRSFMIPLSSVKRPIGGSALFLGIFGIAFALLGFPIDIAVFPPLIYTVLLFGVYLPLLEVGLNTLKTLAQKQIAAISIIAGLAVNPVIGWITAVLVENLGLIKDEKHKVEAAGKNVKITLIVAVLTIISYIISMVI